MKNIMVLEFVNGTFCNINSIGSAETHDGAREGAMHHNRNVEWDEIYRTLEEARTAILANGDLDEQIKEFISAPSEGGFLRLYELEERGGVEHRLCLWC